MDDPYQFYGFYSALDEFGQINSLGFILANREPYYEVANEIEQVKQEIAAKENAITDLINGQ